MTHLTNHIQNSEYAFAIRSAESRFFFITPWHNRSLIGTAHLPYDKGPDEFKIYENDIENFIKDINKCSPSLSLRKEEILFYHGGLIPSYKAITSQKEVQIVDRCQIVDHYKSLGVGGLISVIGVKYTEARRTAEKVIDYVFKKLGYKPPKSKSNKTAIYGGSIECFNSFLSQVVAQRPYGLGEDGIQHLILNYGSAFSEVLRCAATYPGFPQKFTEKSRILTAEVLYAVREEMAQKLVDVVFRRTELSGLGYPGDECLNTSARLMSNELGWDQNKTEKELNEVKTAFSLGTAACA